MRPGGIPWNWRLVALLLTALVLGIIIPPMWWAHL